MVTDITLLQGKIIEDPDLQAKNLPFLLEELTREILELQEATSRETGGVL